MGDYEFWYPLPAPFEPLSSAANDSNAAGLIDVETSRCLFSQAFDHLKNVKPECFSASDRPYSVSYVGEQGIDAGGECGRFATPPFS